MPTVLTADRLADGVVVFQASEQARSESFSRAAARPAEAAARSRERKDVEKQSRRQFQFQFGLVPSRETLHERSAGTGVR